MENKYVVGILLLIIGIGLIATQVFKPQPKEPITNITNTTQSQIIPVLERIVVLVRYNQTECPNLAVFHRNQTINISKVKNITTDVYYAELGRYDTNDPNTEVAFEWLNKNNCTPNFILITNTNFLQYIMSLGVPLDNSTKKNLTEKPAEQNETLIISEQKHL